MRAVLRQASVRSMRTGWILQPDFHVFEQGHERHRHNRREGGWVVIPQWNHALFLVIPRFGESWSIQNKGNLHPDPVFIYLATLNANLMVGNPGTGDVLQCLVGTFDA